MYIIIENVNLHNLILENYNFSWLEGYELGLPLYCVSLTKTRKFAPSFARRFLYLLQGKHLRLALLGT